MGYASQDDILECPCADHHEWVPCGVSDYGGLEEECVDCAALLIRTWWGWIFKTGLEHFAEAEEKYPPLDEAV